MKKKILFLYYNQFGYHTDLYMYCKYLDRDRFDIHYFCIDQGLPKVSMDNLSIHYQAFTKSRVKSYLSYFWHLRSLLKKENFDLIFFVDGKFSLIIRLLTISYTTIFDIRSGDLSDNHIMLWFKNLQISIVASLFKNVSIISQSLCDLLKLNYKTKTIIPLGGEQLIAGPKTFQKVKLLYVGSLDNRNVHETVLGLAIFLKQKGSFQNITYDIIGFGKNDTVEDLVRTIKESALDDKVIFHGRKRIDELIPFFEDCNIGIVYVPQTKAYDCQPSTKLFECLLSGMPVIATNTYENRTTLKPESGIITEDNPESFSQAMEQLIQNLGNFSSAKIKEQYSEYQWKNIVEDRLEPYLNSLIM